MLIIQDPTNRQLPYLLESLVDVMQGAEGLAGAFAFASSRGVSLLTQDAAFQTVAQNHPIDLVVGVDAITNEPALDSLAAVSAQHPNVQVRAYLNPKPGSIFHPKFVWTQCLDGGHLITGSGNLTEGGLLGNWEAYSEYHVNCEHRRDTP